MAARTLALVGLLVVSSLSAGEAVQAEILEGTIPARSWDLQKAQVTDRFQESAFALPVLPTRYSRKGHPLDRSAPFVVRASQSIHLPPGEYRLLMRARNAARLFIDDQLRLELAFPKVGINGHEAVPVIPEQKGVRLAIPGQVEKRASIKLDGARHVFRWEVMVGGLNLRPEPGDAVVAISRDGQSFQVLGGSPALPFTEDGWDRLAGQARVRHRERDAAARRQAAAEEVAYWQKRHDAARACWKDRPAIDIPVTTASAPIHNVIDRFIGKKLEEAGLKPAPLAEDEAFLRRVTLDTVGVVPTPEELAAYRADRSPQRRERVIERLLNDPRWADHWVSYWQDVLAENPGLLKPTLNNTGPFRWWLHEVLADNLPMDRFVTELALMEGSVREGGPAGFGIATENDVPMAAKAQTLTRAFLAADLSCARCHDSPSRSFKQDQLFSFAALLERKPIKVPAGSTVQHGPGGRVPAVKSTLKAGQQVSPAWKLQDLALPEVPAEFLRDPKDDRERVAAILTGPHNERFARVLVNRVWKRYLGVGIVEPVDDWRRAKPSHPELLAWLGRELITHDYDLKHVARLILNSHTYQRVVLPQGNPGHASLFASPARRRMSAEQVIDSLFALAGKEFGCEELNFDPEGRMPIKQCLNLGTPRRAWQFAGLANERDRPALALPRAQGFVDVLTAYGWRESRGTSQTTRDDAPTPLQAITLANGVLHRQVARLSDDSAFTAMCLEDVELKMLVRRIVERIMSRPPTASEEKLFVELLAEGYEQRRTGKAPLPRSVRRSTVSWSNHLSPEATRQKLEQEEAARAGDPPTPRLKDDWRTRMEDALWALLSSPEFVFVP